jgi:hypothetical protein
MKEEGGRRNQRAIQAGVFSFPFHPSAFRLHPFPPGLEADGQGLPVRPVTGGGMAPAEAREGEVPAAGRTAGGARARGAAATGVATGKRTVRHWGAPRVLAMP